jgi:TolB-like protein/tetratricopeptide (TPR) repeat protein
MAFPLPDKPSIAVLPFTNLSDDPSQEYFVDGMTEDLITDLSKISGLFVIARNSSFSYKGQQVKVRQVAEELGVRYVLEGSVRRAGDQVRINAQLIDATTGGHLWAERYDSSLTDVFALQDKVTHNIVTALAVQLTSDEMARTAAAETDSVEAYDALLQGWEYYDRRTGENLAKAISRFEKAVKIDPDYTRANAALALTYWIASERGLDDSLGVSWREARHRARRYLERAMTKPTSVAHQVASMMALKQRLYAEAVHHSERAIALDPSDARAHGRLAYALVYDGRLDQAIEAANRALRLNPKKPRNAIQWLGRAHFSKGDLSKALTYFERARTHSPGFVSPGLSLPLAATYAQLGRDEDARAALQHYTKLWTSRAPTLRDVMKFWPFKDLVVAKRFAEGLLKAGLSGPLSGYYVVAEGDRVGGDQIGPLILGHAIRGIDPDTGSRWIQRVTDTGTARCSESEDAVKREYCAWHGPSVVPNKGEIWIKDEMLCDQFEVKNEVVETCFPVFRNPNGGRESFDEYLAMTDVGIYPFSPVE